MWKGEYVMDADGRLIEMVEDDQGEGIKDFVPDEEAKKLQLESQLEKLAKKEQQLSAAEEMMENLQEDKEPIPWLPELGTKFILEFEQGEREYKVTYINEGKYRFSCEPMDKGYLK